MKQLHTVLAFVLVTALTVALGGCASETYRSGELSVNLIVGDIDVTSVSYDLTCDAGFSLSGEFNVNDEQDPPVWAAIMDVPAGDCTIAITAFNDSGDPVCTGSKDFTVVPNETVKVDLVVLCPVGGLDPVGNVDIDVTFEIVEGNNCPRVHLLNVVPDEVPEGGSVVTVWVSDADGDALTTTLSATGGSFVDSMAQSTLYTCDDASGGQTVSVMVSDGDTACDQSKSFDVTCPGVNLCDGVTCDDDGNECTDVACNQETGQCETTNNTDPCDGGNGTCNGGVCGGGDGELTVNGDFETGDISGWTDFSAPNRGTFAATMAQASGGLYSGNLVASVPPQGGFASFPLVKQANIGVGTVAPNSPITISFDLFGSLAGAGGVVLAEFFSELSGGGTSSSEILSGGPLFPVAPNDWTAGWVTYTFDATTGPDVSGGVTLRIMADCGATPGCTLDIFIDNVSVKAP